jgi:hypothetical protein
MYGPSNEFSRDHLQPDSHAKYIFQQGQALRDGCDGVWSSDESVPS